VLFRKYSVGATVTSWNRFTAASRTWSVLQAAGFRAVNRGGTSELWPIHAALRDPADPAALRRFGSHADLKIDGTA
jgi:hypothetical protein